MKFYKWVKVFFIIATLLMVTQVIVWKLLSSDKVNALVSQWVVSKISTKTNCSINYSKVRLKMFPPGVVIEDIFISFKKPVKGISFFSLIGKEVGVDLNVFTYGSQKLKIGNISLKNGEIKTTLNIGELPESESKLQWDISLFNEMLNSLSFKQVEIARIGLENIAVKTNYGSLFVNQLSAEKYKKSILSKVILSNGTLTQETVKLLGLPENFQHSNLNYVSLDLELTKDLAQLRQLEVSADNHKIQVSGEIAQPFHETKNEINFSGHYSLDNNATLKKTFWYSSLKKTELNFSSLEGSFSLTGDLLHPVMDTKTSIKNFLSPYTDLKDIELTSYLNLKKWVVTKIWAKDLRNGELESGEIDASFIWKSSLPEIHLEARTNQLDLTNAIKYVKPLATSVSAKITGNLKLDLTQQMQKALITVESAIVKKLLVHQGMSPIFSQESVSLKDSFINIDNDGVDFQGELTLLTSPVHFKGSVATQGKIAVETDYFTTDLGKLSPISGLLLAGTGRAKVVVSGQLPEPMMFMELKEVRNASIEKYFLGELAADISIDFQSKNVAISRANAVMSPAQLSASGTINFGSTAIDLAIDIKNLSFNDFRKSHAPILPWDLSWLDSQVLSASGKYLITGKIQPLSALKVEANLFSPRINFMGENLFEFKTHVQFLNEALVINDTSVKLGRGKFNYDLFYDLKSEKLAAVLKTSNLSLSDLNLYKIISPGFKSDVELDFAMKGDRKGTNGFGNLHLYNTSVGADNISDSYAALQLTDDVWQIKSNFWNNRIVTNSVLDFKQTALDKDNRSFFTAKVNLDNMYYLSNLVGTFGKNDSVSIGKLAFEMDALFNLRNFSSMDFEFWLKEFSLPHESISIYKTDRDRIVVERGVVNKWDIILKSLTSRDKLISRASGTLGKNFNLENVLDLHLQKLNYLTDNTFNVSGLVNAWLKVYDTDKGLMTKGEIKSNDFTLSSKKYLAYLGKSNIDIKWVNKHLSVENFQSKLGVGSFSLSGFIDNFYTSPVISLQYNFQDAVFPLASKSSIQLDGTGSLSGDSPPYALSGSLHSIGGEMLNELDEIVPKSNQTASSYRYLPVKEFKSKVALLSFNINAQIDKPYVIRNTLMDVALSGSALIQGNSDRFTVDGKIFTKQDRDQMINIKNNIFKFTKLNFLFDPKWDVTNPVLDIELESFISNYMVKSKIYGPVKSYKLDLTSEPNLPRQGILSLIAFGYAEDVSENLSSEERESLSSIGVGAFIFDQLKLNETLHNNLGVTLKIGTEYVSEKSSMLQGRNSQSSNQVGRVKTATRLELKKKINDKNSLSVSSTILGGVGQKQSMNFNHYINKNISLDGIYEVNSDSAESDEKFGSSGGADIKFKWSFK
jgi:hypothetical protein